MKHSVVCDQPGCDFTYTHLNPKVANRVLGNHKRRQHGIIGKSTSAQWKAKNDGKTVAARNSEPLSEAPAPLVVPNYCPNCGCSIRTVMAAMNLRAKR